MIGSKAASFDELTSFPPPDWLLLTTGRRALRRPITGIAATGDTPGRNAAFRLGHRGRRICLTIRKRLLPITVRDHAISPDERLAPDGILCVASSGINHTAPKWAGSRVAQDFLLLEDVC